MKSSESQVRCAAAAPLCLISDRIGDELQFSQLDINAKTQKFLRKLPISDDYDWDVSPDGKWLALVHSELSDNRVHVVPITDCRANQEILLPAGLWFEYVTWAANGKRLYIAANAPKKTALLSSDLNGRTKTAWQSESGWAHELVASPDGKYVAFTVGSPGSSNAWAVDRF